MKSSSRGIGQLARVVFFIGSWCLAVVAFGQEHRVTIHVNKLYSNTDGGCLGRPDHDWNLSYSGSASNNFSLVGCWKVIDQNVPYTYSNPSAANITDLTTARYFRLKLQGWEGTEDADECEYYDSPGCASGDDLQAKTQQYDLDDLEPFEPTDNQQFYIRTIGPDGALGHYYVEGEITWRPDPLLAPDPITYSGNGDRCPDETLILSTVLDVPNVDKVVKNYQWEVSYTTGSYSWKIADYTTNRYLIIPFKSLPGYPTNLSNNKQIRFRVRANYTDNESWSKYSTTVAVDISPAAPTFTYDATPSCALTGTAKIDLSVTGSTYRYRYFLRPGYNNTGCINPDDDDCLYGQVGSFNTSSKSIPYVSPGKYTLVVSNNGDTRGICYTAKNIEVMAHDDLYIGDFIARHNPCPGDAEGSLVVTAFGGDPDRDIIFSLNGSTDGFERESRYRGTFTNLSAGAYTLLVNDGGCSPLWPQDSAGVTITITDPATPVTLETDDITNDLLKIDPTCSTEPNGTITVYVKGGGGRYVYDLEGPVHDLQETDLPQRAFENLPGGTYVLHVYDADLPACDPLTLSDIYLPPILPPQITFVSSQDVTCANISAADDDGTIILSATEGTGHYAFYLTGATTTMGTDGVFHHLTPGDYTAYVRSADVANCSDADTLAVPIRIAGREPVQINLQEHKHLTCFDEDNGKLAVAITSERSQTYQWQYRTASADVWSNVSSARGGTTLQIDQLFPADYRLVTTDTAECIQTSEIFSIRGPAAPLQLMDLVTIPETCEGGNNGKILVQVAGGWGQYLTTYAGDDLSFTTFTDETGFGPGEYLVRIADAEECTVEAMASIALSNVAFQANFLTTSEAYVQDTVVLVEVCYPQPDSLTWDFDEGVMVLPEQAHTSPGIMGMMPGTFTITLTGYFSTCTDEVTKVITFIALDETSSGRIALGEDAFKTMQIFPNPGNGQYTAAITLHTQAPLQIQLYNLQGNILYQALYDSQYEHTVPIDLTDQRQGIYLMKLTSLHHQKTVRLIKNR